MIDKANLPKHVAIIMDGNGRWAEAHKLPKIAGHHEGVKRVKDIVTCSREIGIKALTVYAFSTENWKRQRIEVDALMGLLRESILKEVDNLKKNQVRLNFIGRLGDLPTSVRKEVEAAMEKTRDDAEMVFNVALSYGSRSEIIDAVNEILASGRKRIDEEEFGNFLYTKGLPDPDLLIRTSGEMRLSNFLLWQLSYAELFFTDKLWPDFKREDFEEAIELYQNRNRRFGT